MYAKGLQGYAGCRGREKKVRYAQLQDSKVREAVVLLTPDLVVQVVLKDADI